MLAVHWGPVSFGIGWGGFLNGGDDGGGYFGSFFGGFYRPYVSVGFGAPYPVWTAHWRSVSLSNQYTHPGGWSATHWLRSETGPNRLRDQ